MIVLLLSFDDYSEEGEYEFDLQFEVYVQNDYCQESYYLDDLGGDFFGGGYFVCGFWIVGWVYIFFFYCSCQNLMVK